MQVLFDSKLYRDDLWHAVKSILHAIKTVRISQSDFEDEITLSSVKSWKIGRYHPT